MQIAWEVWSADGYRTRTSKEHTESDAQDGVTVCGVKVPQEGNGVLFTAEGDGACKACCKYDRRMATEWQKRKQKNGC